MRMRTKKIASVFLAAAMALSVAACGANGGNKSSSSSPASSAASSAAQSSSASSSESGKAAVPIQLKDMIGREVTITPGSYKKVVCIGAGALRTYTYIGDASLLAGVEDIDNESLTERPKMFDSVARPYVLAYGDVFKALPSCGVGGPNAQAAEAEKILTCKPDIVISEYEDVDKENALEQALGVPVVTLKTGPDGVFDENFTASLRMLGKIFNEDEKAEKLISFVEKETAELKKRTADITDDKKPSVYICGLGNWGTTDHLMTAQGYKTFEILNIKNAVSGLEKNGIQKIEAEKFVSIGDSTDIMIIDAAAVKNIKPLYKENPGMFDSMKAWKNGEVYLQMAYNAYYTNFETALINAWFIGKSVYPDKFSDVDIVSKTNEVTKAFLGKELSDKIVSCPSSFGGYQKIDTATFFAN